jgi:hypothetical protein
MSTMTDEHMVEGLNRLRWFISQHSNPSGEPLGKHLEVLNRLVKRAKRVEELALRNAGIEAQLIYLLEAGVGWDEILNDLAATRLRPGSKPRTAKGAGTYTMAVYYRGDQGEWRHLDNWTGRATADEDARQQALNALEDVRIDGWKAEVIDVEPDEDEEDDDAGD